MKKLISLIVVFVFTTTCCVANEIPKSLLKGIEKTTDEFTGEVSYMAKNSEMLKITTGEKTTLELTLYSGAYEAPIKLEKIYILTNGKTTIIENKDNFKLIEQPMRYMIKNATGKIGTSSYKMAEYGTRIFYREEWRTYAIEHLDVLKSIAANGGKVKFDGENQDKIHEFTKKEIKAINAMINLYNFLNK